jgi:hypothetical protein
MTYKLEIWHRRTVNGEQEKDFDYHIVIADSLKEAVEKGLAFFSSNRQKPFAVYHNKVKIDLKTFTYESSVETK